MGTTHDVKVSTVTPMLDSKNIEKRLLRNSLLGEELVDTQFHDDFFKNTGLATLRAFSKLPVGLNEGFPAVFKWHTIPTRSYLSTDTFTTQCSSIQQHPMGSPSTSFL